MAMEFFVVVVDVFKSASRGSGKDLVEVKTRTVEEKHTSSSKS